MSFTDPILIPSTFFSRQSRFSWCCRSETLTTPEGLKVGVPRCTPFSEAPKRSVDAGWCSRCCNRLFFSFFCSRDSSFSEGLTGSILFVVLFVVPGWKLSRSAGVPRRQLHLVVAGQLQGRGYVRSGHAQHALPDAKGEPGRGARLSLFRDGWAASCSRKRSATFDFARQHERHGTTVVGWRGHFWSHDFSDLRWGGFLTFLGLQSGSGDRSVKL